MLRVTRLTDYASLLLCQLAVARGTVLSAATLAERTGLPLPTVSKLLKSLGGAGLVRSRRGAHGGYALSRDPSEINAAELVTAIEGPLALTECSREDGQCEIEDSCAVRTGWQGVTAVVHRALEKVTLAELTALARPHLCRTPVATTDPRLS